MVRNIAILAAVSVAVLLAIIGLCLSRSRSCDEGAESSAKSTAKAIPKDTGELLANEESEECIRGFGEIYNAYSNLQSDAMQKHFCAISNKVVRLGKERLAEVLSPFEASFGARFCHSDIKTLKFSSVSEFDRFIKANIEAANIIGYSKIMNGIYSDDLCVYDMVVFYKIRDFIKEFKEKNADEFAKAAQMHLDERRKHLASGRSVTRMYLGLRLRWCLSWPRWKAEDLGIKSERDWIEYMRDHALKFHKQRYGVVPTWIDEEFPVAAKGE